MLCSSNKETLRFDRSFSLYVSLTLTGVIVGFIFFMPKFEYNQFRKSRERVFRVKNAGHLYNALHIVCFSRVEEMRRFLVLKFAGMNLMRMNLLPSKNAASLFNALYEIRNKSVETIKWAEYP